LPDAPFAVFFIGSHAMKTTDSIPERVDERAEIEALADEVTAIAGHRGLASERWDEVILTAEERTRYARHITLPEVGADGQRRLKAARVLCIGAGGLGSPAALYLAAAGVGTLGIVDPDRVELTNLQRQILHGTSGEGRPKVDSARERLLELNPGVTVELFPERFDAARAREIVAGYDVVVDGTDNFATRYLSNDVCCWAGIPNVYGSIYRFEGQCAVFAPATGGPCYRCMFPEPPPPGEVPSCSEIGVLGVLPGLIGTLQATEALKLILGIGQPLVGRLLHFDALTCRMREFQLRKNPACPLCGEHPSIREPVDYEAFCGAAAGAEAAGAHGIAAKELKRLIEAGEGIAVIDVRDASEREICRIEGSIPMPLGELSDRVRNFPKELPMVVHCKSDWRSLKALELMRRAGFINVRYLKGGILAWAAAVDPGMARY
jgi:adenylyltransferase/sulfurtransferase